MRPALTRFGLAAAVLAMLGGAAAWLADQAMFVTTSDARVRARMVTLSSEIAGRITHMPIASGDRIARGEAVVRLDDRQAKLALAAAALDLKSSEIATQRARLDGQIARRRGEQRVWGRESGLAGAVADLASAEAALDRTEKDHARKLTLHAAGFVAQAAVERSAAELEIARQATKRAAAHVADSRAQIGEAHSDARTAELAEKDAEALAMSAHALQQRLALLKSELEQHVIVSPFDGVVDEVFAEVGEHVAPGTRLALGHAPEQVWLEANIKETELPRIRLGARVDIRFDASRIGCHGIVERIGAATTSEFALVPNANPAGVFTKITQRVPVRVTIGADCGVVRPGAMATLRIQAA